MVQWLYHKLLPLERSEENQYVMSLSNDEYRIYGRPLSTLTFTSDTRDITLFFYNILYIWMSCRVIICFQWCSGVVLIICWSVIDCDLDFMDQWLHHFLYLTFDMLSIYDQFCLWKYKCISKHTWVIIHCKVYT